MTESFLLWLSGYLGPEGAGALCAFLLFIPIVTLAVFDIASHWNDDDLNQEER